MYSNYDNSMDCLITVDYTPSAAGQRSASITLLADGGEKFTLNLSGTVAGSVMAVDEAVTNETSTSTVTSLLNSSALFSGSTPYAVATDGAGNVYAAVASGQWQQL